MTENPHFRTMDNIGYHHVVYTQGMIASSEMWGRDVNEGWYPCEWPERQTDPYVMWHYYDAPCVGCRIAARALQLRNPDDPHVGRLVRQLDTDPKLVGNASS